MAKTKTKKEKIVDLKPKKISDEHLKSVQEAVNDINRSQLEVGILSSRKHNLLHSIAGLQDKLTMLQETLEKNYGTSDINIHDGSINYPENGKTDKKD